MQMVAVGTGVSQPASEKRIGARHRLSQTLATGDRRKSRERRRADLARMREKEKDPSSAKSERFPALVLSRSGSKGISHPRHTDNQQQIAMCSAGPPR